MDILATNRKGGPSETTAQFMKRALVSSDYELEWIYGSHPRNPLLKSEFLTVLNYLRQTYKFKGETNDLDIRSQYIKLERSGLSNIRCTISGVQNIKKYCLTNSIVDIPTVKFMKKISNKDDKNPTLSFDQIINTDYNFRINLKKETDLVDDDPEVIKFRDSLKESSKYYRYKKRFSFVTNDNLFRIDLTAVKSNSYNPKRKTYNLAKNLVDSRILVGKEIYELEIEYIGYSGKDVKAIEEFSKRVYSEWDSEGLSKEDYESQVALVSRNDDSVSFTPGSGSNYYVGSDHDVIFDSVLQESYNNPFGAVSFDPVSFDVQHNIECHTMNTPWAKAAGLKGDPLELIYMSYWHPNKQWLFWLIKDNDKQILFDGVKENWTDEYDDAPKNTTYIKYTVYPPPMENDKLNNSDYDIIYREELVKGFDGTFYVPFSWIYGLEGKKSEELSAGSDKSNSGQKGKPSWGPKGLSRLAKDKRFVDVINIKLGVLIGQLLKTINGTNLMVSRRKTEDILNDYKTLTEQNGPRVNFVGPQPVSMGKEMLNPDNPHNILRGYVVTEKADGVRAELFIDKNSDGYLITQKKKIIYTGLLFKGVGSCILDGEYITEDRNGKEIKLFMIFDIYYMDSGKYPGHPYTLPWLPKKKDLPSRLEMLHDFKNTVDISVVKIDSLRGGIYSPTWSASDKEIDVKDTIRIGYKQYYDGPKTLKKDKNDPTKYTNIRGIGKMSKKILDLDKNDNYEYTVDGLIFMPMNLPVSSNNEEVVVDNIGVTWYQNYKWKPPEENTIDFRVKFIKDDIKGKSVHKITSFTKKGRTIKCLQVHLNVGYDINKDTTTDFTWKIMGHDHRKKNEILFNPPSEKDSIHICNIPLINGKLLCLKDKTVVQDGQIYEMRYEPTNPFGYQWIPLRVRDDKTRPNDSHTASNVWKTIQFPVTESHITGQLDEIHTDISKEESDYYIENPDSDADISLRSFHNYLKDKLINSIISGTSGPISILDTSIGRGGDINKYLRKENNISFFMGLDISSDINKAAKRFYLKGDKTKVLFLQYDTSKSISGGEACVGNHIERNKLLIDILYSRQRALPKELRTLVPKYKGLGKKGFDLISSQFSIHYYFSDELTLRTYIQNISDNLKKGGKFIGTCYDGMKVFQKLSSQENGQLEMIDEFGNRVYSITKKYEIDDFSYQKDNIEKLFGQEIDVYMNSIGQEMKEYLVNFELFIEIMKEYDLVLKTPPLKGSYKGLFDKLTYTEGLGGFELMIDELDKLYSKDLSLKQYYAEALLLTKPKNTMLKELSSLNNWFIFEKK
tara:strand:+ start:606 stop:4493 length:3888 start_codon:yes stop_codon:yes gene_type:complete